MLQKSEISCKNFLFEREELRKPIFNLFKIQPLLKKPLTSNSTLKWLQNLCNYPFPQMGYWSQIRVFKSLSSKQFGHIGFDVLFQSGPPKETTGPHTSTNFCRVSLSVHQQCKRRKIAGRLVVFVCLWTLVAIIHEMIPLPNIIEETEKIVFVHNSCIRIDCNDMSILSLYKRDGL